MTATPTNRKELFDRLIELMAQGWHVMPDHSPYRGTGGPGIYLEHLLGFEPNSRDLPDALGWELKWHTARTNFVTLFHKTPDNSPEIIRYMVRKHGIKDAKGRLSFRHTINPGHRSAKFTPVYDNGVLIMCPRKGNGPVPRWTAQGLEAAAGAKLRRLLLVKGEKDGQRIRFLQTDAYQEFSIVDFIAEVERGTIVIDFDVRESKPGSIGMRDHGTKFRIKPEEVCRLYMDKQRLR